MAEARSRGYFGIGVEGVSKSANVGALLPGYSADLLLFRWDEVAARLEVVATVAAGRLVFSETPEAPRRVSDVA